MVLSLLVYSWIILTGDYYRATVAICLRPGLTHIGIQQEYSDDWSASGPLLLLVCNRTTITTCCNRITITTCCKRTTLMLIFHRGIVTNGLQQESCHNRSILGPCPLWSVLVNCLQQQITVTIDLQHDRAHFGLHQEILSLMIGERSTTGTLSLKSTRGVLSFWSTTHILSLWSTTGILLDLQKEYSHSSLQ